MIEIARLRVLRLALACVVWLAGVDDAAPAQISVSSGSGPSLVTVAGELDFADTVEFLRKTQDLIHAVVLLKSPGGNAVAGVQIGRAIRQKGFRTVVPSAINCASACALAWLGGTPRLMAESSQIGFHAAYVSRGGRARRSTTANAVVTEYLRGLALPRRTIAHITGAPPERMYWLSIDDARSLGIEAGTYTQEGITGSLDKAPAASMKRVPAIDLIGLDLPGMPIRNIDAADCEARCVGDGECAAFTFNQKHSACFLKASAELAIGYPWAISGYRARLEAGIRHIAMTVRDETDYPGNDIDRLKGMKFKTCLLACSEAEVCKAFTFVAARGECWLKNDIGSAEPASGLVSGTK
ncbi:PAN domain-containing protein [Taklimakanibacter lacteus]|uniref:PAN domain-containing protein n=1 Tax=Taklimakanibacter lacteus TaxID=2268456 RepID=UPI000E65EC00